MASPPKSPSEPSAAPDTEKAQPASLDSEGKLEARAEGDPPPVDAAAAAVPPVADIDDDDDDEDLIVFTAREAAGAFATVYHFTLPFLKNYKHGLAIVGFGLLVETLFNVIMPLSLKFLIDDALSEEDLQTLYRILFVLAAAGIVTSIVAVWYEKWDARTASGLVSDVRATTVRSCAEPAGGLLRQDQARRDPLALLGRHGGL